MRMDGKKLNFVFLDLSKLDAASASAFLGDWAQRTTAEAVATESRCHWILNPSKSLELFTLGGPGPDFLRSRLAGGDRLFWINPTGFNWDLLFPWEAQQELQYLADLTKLNSFVFLESTPMAPDWIGDLEQAVFRASLAGLCVESRGQRVCLPWALKDNSQGVWWIVPGQALLTALPSRPWFDLPDSLSGLWESGNGRIDLQVLPSPVEKHSRYDIGVLRRASSPTPLQRSVLFRPNEYPGLGTKEAVDFDEALGGIRKRSLIANMQGQTELIEQGLSIRFQGGRLVSITDATAATVLCSATDSYLDWGGHRHSFVVNSAFSFEGDFSWGLRQSLVLAHEDLVEPARAIIDFFFVEESREFFVAATVRWPRWRSPVTVDRWAILEMSLFDLPGSQSMTTRTFWPDGRCSDQIHRGQTTGVLTGTDFVLTTGSAAVVLGFPQNQTPQPHKLPWTRERHWTSSHLVVNPEGGQSPRPSSQFEGQEEHFNFYLARVAGAKLPFTVTRKQAAELIPPYVMDVERP